MNEIWVVVTEKSYNTECRKCPLFSQWWFLDGLYFCTSKEKAKGHIETESAKMQLLDHWGEDASVSDFEYTTFQDSEDQNTTYKYTIEKRNVH